MDGTSIEGGEVGNNETGFGFFDQVHESATDEVNFKYISIWLKFNGHLSESSVQPIQFGFIEG